MLVLSASIYELLIRTFPKPFLDNRVISYSTRQASLGSFTGHEWGYCTTRRAFSKGAARRALCSERYCSGGVGKLLFSCQRAVCVCGVSVTMMITTNEVTEPNNFQCDPRTNRVHPQPLLFICVIGTRKHRHVFCHHDFVSGWAREGHGIVYVISWHRRELESFFERGKHNTAIAKRNRYDAIDRGGEVGEKYMQHVRYK